MTSPIEIHEEPNLTRMILPNRPQAVFVILGCSSFGVALVIGLLVVFAFGVQIQLDLEFLFYGIPLILFILGGCLIFLIGYLGSRIEIELYSDRLVMIDYFGPCRVIRQCPRQEIRRIVVQESIFPIDESQKLQPSKQMTSRISIEGTFMDPLHFGLGYSLELLRQVAKDLSRRCGSTELSATPGRIPVIEIGAEEPFGERDDLPPSSRATIEEAEDGITIRLPPRGVWRSSSGLFVFSLIWLGLMSIPLILMAPMIFQGKISWESLVALGFALLIGAGMLLSAVASGRSQAVLAVVGDQLLVYSEGLFRSRREQWHRDQLRDIRIGKSNVTVNNEPLIEMKLIFPEGKPKGLLMGRDEEELRWAATQLRRSLRLPKPSKIVEVSLGP